jgi:hypothetical protein
VKINSTKSAADILLDLAIKSKDRVTFCPKLDSLPDYFMTATGGNRIVATEAILRSTHKSGMKLETPVITYAVRRSQLGFDHVLCSHGAN